MKHCFLKIATAFHLLAQSVKRRNHGACTVIAYAPREIIVHPSVISPKKEGWWKLGSGVSMGLHDMKWGTGRSSPHL
jgi:hypothetical protein